MRARGQFAPLVAKSPNAYALWTQHQSERDAVIISTQADGPEIIALVDIRSGFHPDHAQTLINLENEGLAVYVIGSEETPTLRAAAKKIEWTKTIWVMPVYSGDCLEKGAVNTYKKYINDSENADVIIYSDDDIIDEKYRLHTPHFKPEWNYELYSHFDYVSGSCIIKISREQIEELETSDDWICELTSSMIKHHAPVRICHMLHHRRKRPEIAVRTFNFSSKAEWPLVSIIIPTRNRVDLLSTCLKGIDQTDYPNMEVIIVDNESDDEKTISFLKNLPEHRYTVIRHPGVFNFSSINNRAVRVSRGQIICLLNNDVEIIEGSWLKTMVLQAQREDVGAVGAKLLYPDGRIQHAGVVIGVGNAAGHAHRFLRPCEQGYFNRHMLPQFATAVTAACLVVQKERFLAVGGLDEENFAVAFNDVDLCLRLNQRGWQSFYEPRATLFHHESVSRGFDKDPAGAKRLAAEISALQKLWHTDVTTDPFHHPDLSRSSEQFVIQL